MKSLILIRLGGLVTIACGLTWVAGKASLYLLGDLNLTLAQAVQILPGVFLAFGAIVAVACVHVLQRGHYHYGWGGTIFFLVAFIGLILEFNGQVVNFIETPLNATAPPLLQFFSVDILGQLIAAIGIMGLGIVTITAQVLPWWCGLALIAGNPVALVVEYLLLDSLLWALWPSVPNPAPQSIIPMMLLAVPLIVVGYAIYRAERRIERPSRVR